MQRELRVLLFTSVLVNLAAGFFAPIYALFVEDIGGSLSDAGTAYSILAVITGVLIFFIGKWEDKIKHQERLVIWGRFVTFVGFLGYLWVDSVLDLYLVHVVLGVSYALTVPAFQSLYSKHLDKGKYASQWGAWNSWVWIVTGISALAGGFLAEIYGFRVLFWLMAGFTGLGWVVSFMLRER